MATCLLALWSGVAGASDADEDEAFFEFLGSFGESDDTWFDPLWLDDVDPALVQDATEENVTSDEQDES